MCLLMTVTCMDPRVVPEQFLGAESRTAVFRNAGGRVSPDVVRTITVLRSLAFKAERATVMVVHHTGEGQLIHTPSQAPRRGTILTVRDRLRHDTSHR